MPSRGLRHIDRAFAWALIFGLSACWAEPFEPTLEPPPTVDPPPAVEPPPTDARGFAPGPMRLRRLSATQYRNAVAELLGPEAADAVEVPATPALNGLRGIGASELAMSAADIAAYERAATTAVETAEAMGPLGPRFLACPAGAESGVCFTDRIRVALDRAFRRAPTVAEVDRYAAAGQRAIQREGDDDAALRVVLIAALQSPAFLYRIEVGTPIDGPPGFRRLRGFELASRLSFFLTDRPPDRELRDLAARGALQDPEILGVQADRLLETPAAQKALAAFYDEYLRLSELARMVKDPRVYPMASPELFADMRTETQALIASIVWDRDEDFRRMFSAERTTINRRLADLYGLPSTATTTDDWTSVALPGGQPRAGLLGHASFLALNSHPVSSSPTLRGKFVQEVLLCRAIPAPPPSVNTEPPEPDPSGPPLTTRQRIALHLSTPACAGCHAAMDPIGLGLENFDAMGAFRTREAGAPIDATSEFNGTPFEGAQALGAILETSDRAAYCIVRNLYRHATGHIEAPWEEPVLREVDAQFAASGYRLKAAMRALVTSDAFVLVKED